MVFRRLFGRGDQAHEEELARLASRLGTSSTAGGSSEQGEAAERDDAPEAGPEGSRGELRVVQPDGTETHVLLSRRPVSIGNAETLVDVFLDDDAFQGVHLRITPLPGGEYRIHGLSRPSVRPYGTNRQQPAEFTLIGAGDQLTIDGAKGAYVLHFTGPGGDQPADEFEVEPAELKIEVRPLDFGEGVEYRDLRLRALAEAPDAYRTTYEEAMQITIEGFEHRYRRVVTEGIERMYVIGEPGEIFGSAQVSTEDNPPEVASVMTMWVNPERRGLGAGRLLLLACEQWARDHGCRDVTLDVTSINTTARDFFERAGYVGTGELEPLRPGSPLQLERFEKSLIAGR